MTRLLDLNELPVYSHWPARLLGEADFPGRQRNAGLVHQEYELEKWGRVLQRLLSLEAVTVEDLLRIQEIDSGQSVACAKGDALYLDTLLQLYYDYEAYIVDCLSPLQPACLIELGSGLGDKVLRIAQKLQCSQAWGGEYTNTGVESGRRLATFWDVNARFEHFNYYEPETLGWMPENAVVFTSHSIEQIPYLPDAFLEALLQKRPRAVLHMEPFYESYGSDSLVSLMRKRYIELNDYNRDLHTKLRALEAAGRIQILRVDTRVASVNPFNPSTAVLWQPATG